MSRRWRSTRRYGYWVRPREWVVAAVDNLRVGDCIKNRVGVILPQWVKRARCDGPHFGEVFTTPTLPDDAVHPSDHPLDALLDSRDRRFDEFGRPRGLKFHVAVGYPPAEVWATGKSSVVCAAMTKGER
jgi:hypothetical protein